MSHRLQYISKHQPFRQYRLFHRLFQALTVFGQAVRSTKQEFRDVLRPMGYDRGGKGSDRNFEHPGGGRVTLSEQPGDDAKPYQEREVRRAIREVEL
jgi:predicted RNA binding protein YcfA (HicA-like mRNA interferase family)